MSKDRLTKVLEKMSDLFWIRLSLWSRYISRQMPLKTTDGIYLNVNPIAGAAAPIAALLLGLLFGAGQLGYDTVYTESMLFLCIAVLFGTFSANLGMLFLAGFVVGEFILAANWTSVPSTRYDGLIANVFRYRIPLLISYGLLAIVTVQIPVLIKQLLIQIKLPLRFNNHIKLGFAMLTQPLLTGTVIYFWVQIMPVLIRPVYTWTARTPRVEAMANFQEYGYVLVTLAVLASLLRVYLQSRTVFDKTLSERMDQIEQKADRVFTKAKPVKPIGDYFHPWVKTVALTLVMAVTLSGLYELWWDALILSAFILVIQAARSRLIHIPLGKWPYWMARIPVLYRLIIAFLLILYFSKSIIEYYYSGYQQTFRPVIVMTGLAMVFVYLLTPMLPEQAAEGAEQK